MDFFTKKVVKGLGGRKEFYTNFYIKNMQYFCWIFVEIITSILKLLAATRMLINIKMFDREDLFLTFAKMRKQHRHNLCICIG
jgi:hypothetical protein